MKGEREGRDIDTEVSGESRGKRKEIEWQEGEREGSE